MRIFSLQDQCNSIVDSAHTIFRKLLGLQNSHLFHFTDKSDCLAKFPFRDKIQERSMTLILGLNPTWFSQVTRSRVKDVFHKFFKRPAIPEIESKHYACANMLGNINALGALQDNWLKHYHPLRVLLSSAYTVKLYWQDSNKSPPDFHRWCIVALGRHIYNFFHLSCHLPSSTILPSKYSTGSWCTQSW